VVCSTGFVPGWWASIIDGHVSGEILVILVSSDTLVSQAGLLTDATTAASRFQHSAMVATTTLAASIHTATLAECVQWL
jgi:hypothetical protein